MDHAAKGGGARNHHYVPQFYLKGFAALRSKDAKLNVYDLQDRRQFQTKPRNVAAQRDYNRVDVKGVDPNHVETGLASVEADFDKAFRRIIARQSIDDQEDFACAIGLMARLFTSSPDFRQRRERFMTDVADNMMRMMISSEERWNSVVKRAKADGVDLGKEVPYAEIRDAVIQGDIAVTTAREALIEQEIRLWPDIIPYLERRNWLLIVSDSSTGEFATSDHPVNLHWSENGDRGMFGPGLGLRETTVTFPLSKHLALLGRFEEGGGVLPATLPFVAAINNATLIGAKRQVYVANDFPVFDLDRSIRQFAISQLWEGIRDRPAVEMEDDEF
jgi:hypothetical protein